MDIEMEESLIACSMLVWCTREVDTEFRQFAFRWYQGMIHGNTVISHFGDVDRKCTFCRILLERQRREELGRELSQAEQEGLAVPDEDRPHIFWSCMTVQNCIQEVYKGYWGVNINVEKKHFLMGKDMRTVESTILYMLTNMYIKYKIWKYKLAGVLPRPRNIVNDLTTLVDDLKRFNKWKMMLPIVRQYLNM
jgi:hypothetical protein